MPDSTTIDALPAPLGGEAVKAGDDTIRALTAKLDGKLHTVGDLKAGLQAADHGLWKLADGRNNIDSSTVNAQFIALMNSLGYAGSDGSHIGVPDYRGRALVGLGNNNDVAALGPAQATGGKAANEGLPVAQRTPKHSSSVTDPQHHHNDRTDELTTGNGIFYGYVAAESYGISGGSAANGVHRDAKAPTTDNQTGVTVGPAGSRPVDQPAYGVANIFVFAGAP